MSEWYYARGGQQSGPVPFEKIVEMARSGGLDPEKDLVWTGTMKDWTPAGKVEGVFSSAPAAPAPPADPANPYAAPQTTWVAPAPVAGEALQEIVPGSEPIDIGACVKRGFDLTIRNFGMILLVGITYIGITFAANLILSAIDSALGLGQSQQVFRSSESGNPATMAFLASTTRTASPLNVIVSQLLSIFMSLGLVRVGLNFVSGRDVSVAQLFGEGRKMLRAIGAYIIFGVAFAIGLLLLIVPGIYIMLRYGQFLTAIVDRDMGIMEAFSYSSSITTNNRLNIFLLGLLSILIVIAGLLALCIGLIFAYPVIWLSWLVSYRWMQYGHKAAMDHPGTTTPLLKSI